MDRKRQSRQKIAQSTRRNQYDNGNNTRQFRTTTKQREEESIDKTRVDDEQGSRGYDLSRPLFDDTESSHYNARRRESDNDVSVNYTSRVRSTSPLQNDAINEDTDTHAWHEADGDDMTVRERRLSRLSVHDDHDEDASERYLDIYDNDNVDGDDSRDTRRPGIATRDKQKRTVAFDSIDDDEVEDYDTRAEVYEDDDEEMLDQSSAELKATIDELEKRYDTIENEANELIKELRDDPEGNEWKTRYETQTEMNQQLEKQILLLQEKVEEAKRNLKEAGKSPRDNRAFDDMSDASPQMVKALEREKNSMFSQLRDLEWRLDQESKAYHKANDERKQYVLEINATKGNIGELKSRQRQMMISAQETPPRLTARSTPGESPRSYRDTGGNIPQDQRILDPRYGPIRKTAGVKALPSIDSN